MAQNAIFGIYMAAILKTCLRNNVCLASSDTLTLNSMGVNTKIVFLSRLEAKIMPKHNLIIVAFGHFVFGL